MYLIQKIKGIIHSDLSPEQKESSIQALIPLWTKEDIEQAVCSYFSVSYEQLKSTTKIPRIVKARHIARYLIYNTISINHQDLAGSYGCDPSQVSRSLKIIKGCIEVQDPIVEDIQNIKKLLVT
jgi:chromosomal replication initiation ATPase DnaA